MPVKKPIKKTDTPEAAAPAPETMKKAPGKRAATTKTAAATHKNAAGLVTAPRAAAAPEQRRLSPSRPLSTRHCTTPKSSAKRTFCGKPEATRTAMPARIGITRPKSCGAATNDPMRTGRLSAPSSFVFRHQDLDGSRFSDDTNATAATTTLATITGIAWIITP